MKKNLQKTQSAFKDFGQTWMLWRNSSQRFFGFLSPWNAELVTFEDLNPERYRTNRKLQIVFVIFSFSISVGKGARINQLYYLHMPTVFSLYPTILKKDCLCLTTISLFLLHSSMFLSLNLLEGYTYVLLAGSILHYLIPERWPKSVCSKLLLQLGLLQFEKIRNISVQCSFTLNTVHLSLSITESRGTNMAK